MNSKNLVEYPKYKDTIREAYNGLHHRIFKCLRKRCQSSELDCTTSKNSALCFHNKNCSFDFESTLVCEEKETLEKPESYVLSSSTFSDLQRRRSFPKIKIKNNNVAKYTAHKKIFSSNKAELPVIYTSSLLKRSLSENFEHSNKPQLSLFTTFEKSYQRATTAEPPSAPLNSNPELNFCPNTNQGNLKTSELHSQCIVRKFQEKSKEECKNKEPISLLGENSNLNTKFNTCSACQLCKKVSNNEDVDHTDNNHFSSLTETNKKILLSSFRSTSNGHLSHIQPSSSNVSPCMLSLVEDKSQLLSPSYTMCSSDSSQAKEKVSVSTKQPIAYIKRFFVHPITLSKKQEHCCSMLQQPYLPRLKPDILTKSNQNIKKVDYCASSANDIKLNHKSIASSPREKESTGEVKSFTTLLQTEKSVPSKKRFSKTRKFPVLLSQFFHWIVSTNSYSNPEDSNRERGEENVKSLIYQASKGDKVIYPNGFLKKPLVQTPASRHLTPLLKPQTPEHKGKPTLVLDLDETLVHSSFTRIPNFSFVISVEIEKFLHNVYVLKRPGVETFLEKMAPLYEIVIFTASLSKYADPLINYLDPKKLCSVRLFRESCVFCHGQFVKDLSRLGRDLKKVIIIDNSTISYAFQPDNAIPVESWFDDMNDTELFRLIPFLTALAKVDDIPKAMRHTAHY